jgi:cyclomaltodextrinase
MKHLTYSLLFVFSFINGYSQQLTVSLASVIELQPNKTTIVKADYFPFGFSNMKIKLPEGLKLVEETQELIVISGKLPRPYDNIEFVGENKVIDIPCRNSRKGVVNVTIELPKPAGKLGVKGSFNNWNTDTIIAKPIGKLPAKNWTIESLIVNEGYHQYKLVADGKETDAVGAELVSNGMGGNNALLKVGNTEGEAPSAFTQNFTPSMITLKSATGNYCLVYWNNELIVKTSVPISGLINIKIPPEVLASKGRSFIRVYVSNKTKVGNDVLIPLENGHVVTTNAELKRTDHHAQIMYFMMVDRFLNTNESNDPKPLEEVLPKVQYQGGDLSGIMLKLKDGYFEKLGVNTLWLSPISQNPKGAWGYWDKQVTTKFSGYHGYWPVSYSKVDERFGTNKMFTELITLSHSKNTNVVLDFVAHHVHVDHPLYKQHPDWATSLYLPDGTMNTERWDDHRLTTWFDTFLPTLNFEKKEVRDIVSDSVMFWVKNFEIDGLRHDASKHVPEEFWRELTQKIKIETAQKGRAPFYQIGETYGSPELIGSYVNSGQMDAQFDFNVYDASVGAFTSNATDVAAQWSNLQRTLSQSFDYYGWHHLMGNISGNQDRPRFASLADGSVSATEDTKLVGWTRNIQNANEKGYLRMAQIMALNMTLPGVPVIYYGDEYAMPGGNDPDNRRVMQFSNYNVSQLDLIAKVKTLTQLRKTNLALLYGEYKTVETEKQFFAYERNYFGKRVIVVFSKNAGRATIPIADGTKYESVFNQKTTPLENEMQVDMKADDVAIFVINN